MSLPSPETINRINELRRKMADGTITLEEQKQGIILLRANRTSALSTSKSPSKAKAKKVIKSADDLLSELD